MLVMVSNYETGANFERKVVKLLESKGYLAVRCAGSKGPSKIAIVAIPALLGDQFRTEDIQLIQCKASGTASQFEKEQLTNAAQKYGCVALIASKDKDGQIIFDLCK